VSDLRRDAEAFSRTVEALGPYLPELVCIGGWAHLLFTLRPEATALPFILLGTLDVDVAAPLRLAPREPSIAQLHDSATWFARPRGSRRIVPDRPHPRSCWPGCARALPAPSTPDRRRTTEKPSSWPTAEARHEDERHDVLPEKFGTVTDQKGGSAASRT